MKIYRKEKRMAKRIYVKVPDQEIVRVKKVLKTGPRTEPKYVWLIDFRGIRTRKTKLYKNKKFGGEKMAFNSPEELEIAVNDYFQSCYTYKLDKNGNIMYDRNGEPIKYLSKPFTISGLAYHIGISTKTFNRYCSGVFDAGTEDLPGSKSYKKILVRARQKVESFAEENLYNKNAQLGARFVLDAAFGWCTTREQAEIKEREFNMWLKEKEFELKQKLLEMGEEDTGLEIKIVRKEN